MIEDDFFFGEVLVVEDEMNLSELSEFIENGIFMLSLNEFVFNKLFCVGRDLQEDLNYGFFEFGFLNIIFLECFEFGFGECI